MEFVHHDEVLSIPSRYGGPGRWWHMTVFIMLEPTVETASCKLPSQGCHPVAWASNVKPLRTDVTTTKFIPCVNVCTHA